MKPISLRFLAFGLAVLFGILFTDLYKTVFVEFKTLGSGSMLLCDRTGGFSVYTSLDGTRVIFASFRFETAEEARTCFINQTTTEFISEREILVEKSGIEEVGKRVVIPETAHGTSLVLAHDGDRIFMFESMSLKHLQSFERHKRLY